MGSMTSQSAAASAAMSGLNPDNDIFSTTDILCLMKLCQYENEMNSKLMKM